jgi:4-hydroxy-tetrahydrodipicolinate synthase
MTLWSEPRWACCATVTPIDADGAVDDGALSEHLGWMMAGGIDGIALFGTCGEGPSFSAAARLAATERLLRAGFDPGRLILGIGSASIPEMAGLARAAGELGLAAVLATPPFFYREVEEEGVYQAYARLIEMSGAAAPPLLLYHIPSVAGIALSPALVARLLTDFPERIRGVKDSGADWAATEALLARVPGPSVLVGAEVHILDAVGQGARGTICGLANVAPRLIARLVAGEPGARADVETLAAWFEGRPFFSTVKALTARRTGHGDWRMLMPPLLPLTEELPALPAIAA